MITSFHLSLLSLPSAGCRAELLLAALERKSGVSTDPPDSYLRQALHYDCLPDGQERLMDAESRAVMMSWSVCLCASVECHWPAESGIVIRLK